MRVQYHKQSLIGEVGEKLATDVFDKLPCVYKRPVGSFGDVGGGDYVLFPFMHSIHEVTDVYHELEWGVRDCKEERLRELEGEYGVRVEVKASLGAFPRLNHVLTPTQKRYRTSYVALRIWINKKDWSEGWANDADIEKIKNAIKKAKMRIEKEFPYIVEKYLGSERNWLRYLENHRRMLLKLPTPIEEKEEKKSSRMQSVKDVKKLFSEDLKKLLCFAEEPDYIVIRFRKFLGAENFSKIASIIRGVGGEYVSAGKDSCFRILKNDSRM